MLVQTHPDITVNTTKKTPWGEAALPPVHRRAQTRRAGVEGSVRGTGPSHYWYMRSCPGASQEQTQCWDEENDEGYRQFAQYEDWEQCESGECRTQWTLVGGHTGSVYNDRRNWVPIGYCQGESRCTFQCAEGQSRWNTGVRNSNAGRRGSRPYPSHAWGECVGDCPRLSTNPCPERFEKYFADATNKAEGFRSADPEDFDCLLPPPPPPQEESAWDDPKVPKVLAAAAAVVGFVGVLVAFSNGMPPTPSMPDPSLLVDLTAQVGSALASMPPDLSAVATNLSVGLDGLSAEAVTDELAKRAFDKITAAAAARFIDCTMAKISIDTTYSSYNLCIKKSKKGRRAFTKAFEEDMQTAIGKKHKKHKVSISNITMDTETKSKMKLRQKKLLLDGDKTSMIVQFCVKGVADAELIENLNKKKKIKLDNLANNKMLATTGTAVPKWVKGNPGTKKKNGTFFDIKTRSCTPPTYEELEGSLEDYVKGKLEDKLKAQATATMKRFYKEFKGKSDDEVKEMLIEKETAGLIGEVEKQQAEWDATQDAEEEKKKKKKKKKKQKNTNPLADAENPDTE
eukprot:COSAG06_NODE_21_length_33796_cov_70.184853_4_plen_569_part_00